MACWGSFAISEIALVFVRFNHVVRFTINALPAIKSTKTMAAFPWV